MIRAIDLVLELEEKILDEIAEDNLKPHERLFSERKLAERYSVPRMKIHQAIVSLTKKGYLYSKRGSGTFVARHINKAGKQTDNAAEDTSFSFEFAPSNEYKTLKLLLPVPEKHIQGEIWKSIVRSFLESYPFIQVETIFDKVASPTVSDVFITTPYKLRTMPRKIFSLENIKIQKKIFPKNIFEIGKIGGQLLAIPILRVPSLLSINMDIFRKYSENLSEIQSPVDLLRIGFELEKRAGKNTTFMGSRYYGALFHGSLYGLEFKRNETDIRFDEATVAKFLEETKPYIKHQHFFPHKNSGIDKFIGGKYCIYPHFSTDLPDISSSGINTITLKLPLLKNGFVCEGMFIGGINAETKNSEEAMILLEFLLSKGTQKLFIEKMPYCLSVRDDLLSIQKSSRIPELDGIHIDFDIRSFYTQQDTGIYEDYSKNLNIEAGKYFTGIQDLKTTISKLHSFKYKI